MKLRTVTGDDVDQVLALNAQSVTELSPMGRDELSTYLQMPATCLVCESDDRQVAAFALAFEPLTAYGSINYGWHAERFDDFLYLDRIAVHPNFRRQGLASLLYDEMEQRATSHARMVCEVNSDPPNPASLAFHLGRGYIEVGHLTQLDGHQTVMLEKRL
ncbi:MAG: GNAT family N-acetyltransferase [Nocardioidaceae bacterium]